MPTTLTVWIMTTNVMINVYLVRVNTNVNANVNTKYGIDCLCVFGLWWLGYCVADVVIVDCDDSCYFIHIGCYGDYYCN